MTSSRVKKSAGAGVLQRFMPAQVRAILVKDFLEMRRDLRNMSQVVTPMILGLLYAIMIVRSGGNPPAGQGEAPHIFMEDPAYSAHVWQCRHRPVRRMVTAYPYGARVFFDGREKFLDHKNGPNQSKKSDPG